MSYKLEKQYRLKGYNYSANGWYFVTICTDRFKPFFGEIKNGAKRLSGTGKVVDQFWREISSQFVFVKLDKYQIMPNHIHGIVIIQRNTCRNMIPCRNMINHVPTEPTDNFIQTFENNFTIECNNTRKWKSRIPNNPMELTNSSLGRIIRWYKGKCTYTIHKLFPLLNFKWQPRYQDRIIRDEEELVRIREYIENNPAQWESDNNYKRMSKK